MDRSSLLAAFAFTAAASSLVAPVAEACTCLVADVIYSYNDNDMVFVGRPIASVHRPGFVVHRFRLIRDLKGCLPAGSIVEVGTPDNEAACGAEFNPFAPVVVFGQSRPSVGLPRMYTTSCSGNIEVAHLSRDDIGFLSTRPVTCGGVTTCTDGSSPVTCLVDPCSAAPPCAGATCVSNACGGCTAEFYDAWGYGACTPW